VCLTTRHVDGFCLWPSKSTDYSVAASPWRNGTGDVVADFVASARKYGIEPCFYIILGFDIMSNHTGVNASAYLAQQQIALTELLAYQPSRLWFDNWALDGATYQPVTAEGFVCPGNVAGPACPAWQTLTDLVRAQAPNVAMVPGADGCLVNAEDAGGTYPVYHAAPQSSYWCTNAAAPSNNTAFVAVESDYSVENPGDEWFWNAGAPLISAEDLWDQFSLKYGQGSTFILNVPPNASGIVPDATMVMLGEFGAIRHGTYDTPVAALAAPVAAPCSALTFTVAVPAGGVFDQLVTVEDLTNGQVINGYTVEAQSAATGAWAPLPVRGVTIGVRAVDWGLGPYGTNVTALRFNCTASLGPPGTVATIAAFGAFLGAPFASAPAEGALAA
jgi:alpha-L-fucosidase